MKKETHILHAGRDPDENFGIVNPPVYHASTVTFESVEAMQKAGLNPTEGVYYGRMGTPTTQAFEAGVAALEGTDRCVAVPSGMGAISGAILAFVEAGDHILMTDSAYMPTRKFCDGFLKKFGVETTYYDPMIGAQIGELIKPNTKIVFTEAPGSLTFEVQDIPAISEVAHNRGCLVMIDNTWGAGVFFDAFKHGCDISIQAATKYIGGHSDVMMGTIAMAEDLYKPVKTTCYGLGFSVSGDDCYLAQRGLRTIKARLDLHESNTLKLAEWLQGRPEVGKILHPAFADCPGHDIWKRDFTGSSGLFSVVLDEKFSAKAVSAMLNGLELFPMGYSWGGYESLVIPFNAATARTATKWTEKGPCLRFHVGQEHVDDLIADLEAGFKRLNAA